MLHTLLLPGLNDYDVFVHVNAHVTAGATAPSQRPTPPPPGPLIVHVNQCGNSVSGAYTYTVGKGPGQNYSTNLSMAEDGRLQDLAVNMGQLLATKFGRPAYVCISGQMSNSEYAILAAGVAEACERLISGESHGTVGST